MSTPIKAMSRLCSPRLFPSKSPKLLSPAQNYRKSVEIKRISPQSGFEQRGEQYKQKSCCNNLFLNVPEVHVINKPVRSNAHDLIINSPKKLNLLKNGINKNDLLYVIGKGSFGTVIKGNYKGDPVAVKILSVNNDSEENQDRNTLPERNALHLQHENIIKIFDIIVNKDDKYGLIFMEFNENSKNLQSVIDNLKTSFDRCSLINYSKDIAKGIQYCHEHDVLHLDIKPKNILLCDAKCKICDFGNSVKASEAISILRYRGTAAYTAPEILLGKPPTTKCDIFSLGILIWQMISRRFPYDLLDNEVVIYKVVKFHFRPDIEAINSMKDFANLCSLCWQEEPSGRPTAAGVINVIDSFL